MVCRCCAVARVVSCYWACLLCSSYITAFMAGHDKEGHPVITVRFGKSEMLASETKMQVRACGPCVASRTAHVLACVGWRAWHVFGVCLFVRGWLRVGGCSLRFGPTICTDHAVCARANVATAAGGGRTTDLGSGFQGLFACTPRLSLWYVDTHTPTHILVS
mgnify:CR=1 FL=1